MKFLKYLLRDEYNQQINKGKIIILNGMIVLNYRIRESME